MIEKEEQQRWIQQAMASKPAPPEDNFEKKAMKAMRVMEDVVFSSGDEVNLDSQVSYLGYLCKFLSLWNVIECSSPSMILRNLYVW